MTDAQLLRDYASAGSQAAFAELVKRHIHLVHAAAMRQAGGDAHRADDITQAVFVVLARRAASIGDQVSITGWLVNTTRYAALSAIKLDARRRFHERRATAMAQQQQQQQQHAARTTAAATNAHDALASTLDAALARLRAKDRSVIALRYLQGKPVSEVGDALGISQQAAQKRIGRALDRLRDILARHGVTTPADVLAGNLSVLGAHVAPAALVSAVVAGGAAPAASASALACATTHAIVTAKTKLIATAVAACLVVGGVAAPIVLNAPHPSPARAAAAAAAAPTPVALKAMPAPDITGAVAPPAATQPAPLAPAIALPNVSFFQNVNPKEFTVGIDDTVRRTPTSDPAVTLMSTTPRWGIGGTALRGLDPAPLRGKRIRFWAYVKCKDLANWGSICLVAIDAGGRIHANDDMGGRPITKTTDWTKMEIVADIPPEVEAIRCGLNLRGKGQIWMDAPQVEIVPTSVPITDDQVWHAWSFSMPHYSTKLDPTTPRNGKPTRLLQSTVAGPGEWLSWDRNDRHPEPYLGKRMKVSMWIKTQNVTGPSGILLRVIGPNYQDIIPNLSKDQRTIRGTTGWTRYEFTADIPPQTQTICTGVRLGGKGKLWVDDVQYELLE